MQFTDFKVRTSAILVIALTLSACTLKNYNLWGRSTSQPASIPQLPTPLPLSENTPDEHSSSIGNSSPTPEKADTVPSATATATQELPEVDWRTVPIMPEVSQRVLEIYQDGQAKGRNAHNFSVIGDCQAIPYVFLGPFGRGELEPDGGESYLWDAINHFRDSFDRWSVTARGGFTAASILNPIQADPNYCKAGETPLSCEYRLNNPAVAFITLETWLDPDTIDRYETYLRKILDYVIEQGTVPILLTKADSAEVFNGKYVINPAITQIAREYEVPVVNFWLAAQYLPNGGIDPTREGFHLSQEGYELKNTLALRALYAVWNAVENITTGNNATDNLPATPTPQALPTSQSDPITATPDCREDCIYFAAAASQDGTVKFRGVYVYEYGNKKLTKVLDEGFNLQDVSEDGQRLLVNNANRLYDVNLADGSTHLISDSFYSLGKQGAYWNSTDEQVIYLDSEDPIQTETGAAFNLFPSPRDEELYFENGSCTSQDFCQSEGVYRLDEDQSAVLRDSFAQPVFSPHGNFVAYLNPDKATALNYYHISYLLLEEPDRGIASRRTLYFPDVEGFMVFPDVRSYAFSPDDYQLFILYDVYSAYFENSLRMQTYLWDLNTGVLYDYGKIDGTSGSMQPHLVWSPQGEKVLFFLTEATSDEKYSLGIFQTILNTEERLRPYDEGIIVSDEYFYLTNLYWR